MTSDADVMVAGGAEAAICEIGIAGFNACKALSTKRADEPEKASRPYDADRDGFVMGEGAGIVVLEEYEHAKARGAKIYAEVLGYGLSGDAYHITAPSEDGEGGERAMRAALAKAGLEPSALDYINAHGTSTMADVIELGAVERMMGDAAGKLTMTSTKSATGHLLGPQARLRRSLPSLRSAIRWHRPQSIWTMWPLKPPLIWPRMQSVNVKSTMRCQTHSDLAAQTPAYCWDASLNVACGCLKRFDAADCYVLGHGWFGHLGQGALCSAGPA